MRCPRMADTGVPREISETSWSDAPEWQFGPEIHDQINRNTGIRGSVLPSVGSSCGADGGRFCSLRNEFRAPDSALHFVVKPFA